MRDIYTHFLGLEDRIEYRDHNELYVDYALCEEYDPVASQNLKDTWKAYKEGDYVEVSE